MLGEIAAAVALLKSGHSLYKYVTGTTLTNKIEHLENNVQKRLERIEKRIYHLSCNEVVDTTKSAQRRVKDVSFISDSVIPLQESTKKDLVISNPIITPERFETAIVENPENILQNINPIHNTNIPQNSDNTMIPVLFQKWGQYFVGYLKVGYAKDYSKKKNRRWYNRSY